ncbi:MAG: hypothetical protein ABFE07_00635, partial [Armatimonadia bacterium]
FFGAPDWLYFSGLPQVLRPAWRVFEAIVKLDHRKGDSDKYRVGEDGLWFRVPMYDVFTMAAMTRPRVYAHVRHLVLCGLIEYEPAEKQCGWATFRVNRDKLSQLYMEIAPALKQVHGGTFGLFKPGHVGLPSGFSIYGFKTGPQVIIDFKDLTTLKARAAEHKKPVDPKPKNSLVLAEIHERLAEVLEQERLEREERKRARAAEKASLTQVT